MDRTDWPDRRIDDLVRRINGLPERVATLAAELAELRRDVREMRRDVEALKACIDQRVLVRDTNDATKKAAFITAAAALAVGLLSSAALLATQL